MGSETMCFVCGYFGLPLKHFTDTLQTIYICKYIFVLTRLRANNWLSFFECQSNCIIVHFSKKGVLLQCTKMGKSTAKYKPLWIHLHNKIIYNIVCVMCNWIDHNEQIYEFVQGLNCCFTAQIKTKYNLLILWYTFITNYIMLRENAKRFENVVSIWKIFLQYIVFSCFVYLHNCRVEIAFSRIHYTYIYVKWTLFRGKENDFFAAN